MGFKIKKIWRFDNERWFFPVSAIVFRCNKICVFISWENVFGNWINYTPIRKFNNACSGKTSMIRLSINSDCFKSITIVSTIMRIETIVTTCPGIQSIIPFRICKLFGPVSVTRQFDRN